jgi:hypothetical protein
MVIPGYTGYIPHKHPEQVFGCTYQTANAYSSQSLPTVQTARVQRPIPGYKGYVAGKAAESFIEEGFTRVWDRSQDFRVHQVERITSARKSQRDYYLRQQQNK